MKRTLWIKFQPALNRMYRSSDRNQMSIQANPLSSFPLASLEADQVADQVADVPAVTSARSHAPRA